MEQQRTKGFLTKKYCLTSCFKRKMSDFWKNILALLLILGVILGIILSIMAIGYVLGTITQYFGFFINKETLDVGMSILLASIFIGFVLYQLFLFGRYIYKGAYNFAVRRYEGDPFECSVFEECEDE